MKVSWHFHQFAQIVVINNIFSPFLNMVDHKIVGECYPNFIFFFNFVFEKNESFNPTVKM